MSNVAEMPNRSQQVVPLRTGGNVAAVVPQSIKEIWEVARGVVASGLAPKNLGSGDDKVSAVAITIMAGMELGLKPMVALRSFTVINGRPALYGDGLIAVVRMSGKAKKVQTGCDVRDGQMVGWCAAERSDTGEANRVEFSEEDARRAGLWSPEDKVRGKVWRENKQVWVDDAPNESPWHRYPQRMLAWRAAGYCLRELFGDVLGGIRDEFEAQEVSEPEQQFIAPPPPEEPEDATDIEVEPLNADKFLDDLDGALLAATDEETLMEVWDSFDVEATLTHDDAALQRAFDLRKKHADELAEDFPGDTKS